VFKSKSAATVTLTTYWVEILYNAFQCIFNTALLVSFIDLVGLLVRQWLENIIKLYSPIDSTVQKGGYILSLRVFLLAG